MWDLENLLGRPITLGADFEDWVLRTLAVLVSLVLVILARRLITAIVVAPLRYVVNRTPWETDNKLFEASLGPLRLIVIAAVLVLIGQVMLPGDSFYNRIADLISRVVVVAAVLMLIYRFIDVLLSSSKQIFALTGLVIEDRLLPFIRVGLKVLLISVGIIIVVQVLGYDVNGLVAALGAGGIGLSLAAKDTLANLFGFVSIVSDRPLEVGDYVVTPFGEGIVEHVGIRSTQLRRLDQALIMIPNNLLNNSEILNWSRLQKRRLDMLLQIHYDTTPDVIQQFVQRARELLQERPTVQEDSIVVYFVSFSASALDVMVRCYIKIADWGEFTAEKQAINLALIDLARENGVRFAYPTTSLYVEKMPDAPQNAGFPPVIKDARPEDKPDDSYKPTAPHGDDPRN